MNKIIKNVIPGNEKEFNLGGLDEGINICKKNIYIFLK